MFYLSLIRCQWLILLIYKIMVYVFYRFYLLTTWSPGPTEFINLLSKFIQFHFVYTDNLMPLPGRSYFNIRVTCISWGPTGEFFGNYGKFSKFWEIHSGQIFKIWPIILFCLISYCTNYIRAKFHVPRTIFQYFIKKNVKS